MPARRLPARLVIILPFFYDLLGQLVEGIDRINCDNFKSILFCQVTHLIIIQVISNAAAWHIITQFHFIKIKTFNQSKECFYA